MNAASLQAIATLVAQERALETVLERIVGDLAAQPNVALTRIWLVCSEDGASRTKPAAAGEASQWLELAASAGRPRSSSEDWSRLDGPLRRVALGSGKIGGIAESGQSLLLDDVARSNSWVVNQQWIEAEGIVSFAGHPLVFRGETLGVLALFSRERLAPDDFGWLRLFADQAAIAMANARAFEEIERLRLQLEFENRYLREEVDRTHWFGEIIGASASVGKLLEQVELVAPTGASVLIQGESGTGKELVARAIHQRSSRRERALVKVNCAAIPRELFESEFFGHVKGAFTGAVKDRVGRFQLADGGTLFLDEVGDIPPELQGKLLRVLQEGQFEPLGDDRTRRVNVRIIAATNRDLEAEAAAGRFRQDLYFRLSVFPIHVVPLRERPDDIRPLAEHFLLRLCAEMRRPVSKLSARLISELEAYDWPGNVRELQHVIERALIVSRSGELSFDGLLGRPTRPAGTLSKAGRHSAAVRPAVTTRQELRRLEAENLVAALQACNWKIYGPRGAAEVLGMPPTTLASRLKSLGIRKPR